MLVRFFKILVEIVGAVVAGAVVLFLLAVWRMSSGPLPLDTVTPYIEEALSAKASGLSVDIGQTRLEWEGWRRAFDLTAREVVISDTANGQVVLEVPSLRVLISVRALLQGVIAPVRITLEGPNLKMRRRADGSFQIISKQPLVQETPGEGGETALDSYVRRLMGPTNNRSRLGKLRSVEIRGAEIRLFDAPTGMTMRAKDADIVVDRGPQGSTVEIAADLDAPEFVTATHLSARFDAASDTLDGTAVFDGLNTRSLMGHFADLLKDEVKFDALLDGSVSFRASLNSGLSVASLVVTAERAALELPGLYKTPKHLQSLSARLDYDAAHQSLQVRDVEFAIADMRAEVNASISDFGATNKFRLDASTWQVPRGVLDELWPKSVGVDARAWALPNIEGGLVHQATIEIEGKLPGLGAEKVKIDRLEGRIDFAGARLHYLRPLPPATEVSGHAKFNLKRFDIFLSAAKLERLRLVDAAIRLTDLDTKIELAEIDVATQGPLEDYLRVLDSEPLGYARALDLNSEQITGLVGARARFEFPLRNDLQLTDIRIGASANLTDVELPQVVLGQSFSDGDLTLKLDGNGMILAGKGRLGEVPISLNLQQFFKPKTSLRRIVRAFGELDQDALTDFGLELSAYVTGKILADVLFKERADGNSEIVSVLDLREAEARIPQIAWRKPAGAAGTLRLSLALKDGKLAEIRDLNMIAADLGFNANATFDPDGAGIASARINRLVIGESDIRGGIARRPNGGYVADLSGPQLDLTPFIEQYDDEDGDSGIPFELNVAFDRVLVGTLRPLSGVVGNVRHDGSVMESVAVTGMIGAGRVSVLVEPDGEGRRFRLTSDQAGQVLQDFDLLENLQGGRLAIDGSLRPGPDGQIVSAHLRVDEFRMADAPALARVLSVASLTGLVDTLSGRGIGFTRLDADILIEPDTISLKDVLAFGPSLGISADGTISRVDDIADIRGMVVPAYGLSRLIDRIPILGRILTGGKREGLLAAEYLLTGDVSKPTVTVNPLTALAPGFLRNLVKATDGSGITASDVDITDESAQDRGN